MIFWITLQRDGLIAIMIVIDASSRELVNPEFWKFPELKDCTLLIFNASNVRGIIRIRNKRIELVLAISAICRDMQINERSKVQDISGQQR